MKKGSAGSLDPRVFAEILSELERRYRPNRPEHVGSRDPFKVLIGAMLSHRTRDEQTDEAYLRLFKRFKDAGELASAPVREIERLIRPAGFYRVKARRIKEVSRIILERYGGRVPRDRDALLSLPGVGEKTADIVLSVAFGLPEIAVDTHVETIAKRLGIADEKDGYGEVKRKLEELTPVEKRRYLNMLLVRFGREICRSPRPRCEVCPFTRYCRYYSATRGASR